MSGVNKVILVGRVGQIETKQINSGISVTNLSLATSETYKDSQGEKKEKTEWHRCVLWRAIAEIAEKYVKKGDMLYLEGKNETRSWEKDGQTHYTTEVICNQMTMLGGKKDNAQNQHYQDDLPY